MNAHMRAQLYKCMLIPICQACLVGYQAWPLEYDHWESNSSKGGGLRVRPTTASLHAGPPPTPRTPLRKMLSFRRLVFSGRPTPPIYSIHTVYAPQERFAKDGKLASGMLYPVL